MQLVPDVGCAFLEKGVRAFTNRVFGEPQKSSIQPFEGQVPVKCNCSRWNTKVLLRTSVQNSGNLCEFFVLVGQAMSRNLLNLEELPSCVERFQTRGDAHRGQMFCLHCGEGVVFTGWYEAMVWSHTSHTSGLAFFNQVINQLPLLGVHNLISYYHVGTGLGSVQQLDCCSNCLVQLLTPRCKEMRKLWIEVVNLGSSLASW